MPEPQPYSSGEKNLGCVIAVVLGIGLLIWIGSLGNSSSTSAGNSSQAPSIGNAAATAPTPPLALDRSAAFRGTAQFKQVAAQHVPGSSELFVRNCYEALAKSFDWHQLDRCGGYDALAVRWTAMNESNAGDDDLTFFQSETAATRYTQAALSGGLHADQADERWSAIERIAAKSRLAAPKPPEALAQADASSEQNLSADDAQNAAAPPE